MFLGYPEFVKITVYLFCDWTQKPMKRKWKKVMVYPAYANKFAYLHIFIKSFDYCVTTALNKKLRAFYWYQLDSEAVASTT